MPAKRPVARRRLLYGFGGVGALALLAACAAPRAEARDGGQAGRPADQAGRGRRDRAAIRSGGTRYPADRGGQTD